MYTSCDLKFWWCHQILPSFFSYTITVIIMKKTQPQSLKKYPSCFMTCDIYIQWESDYKEWGIITIIVNSEVP